MRRVAIWLTGLVLALTATACGGGSDAISTVSHQGQTYRDSAGWTVVVPRGWHVTQFSDTKNGITSAGIQLSNVGLPPPSLIPGYPIQVNGRVLPAHAVGLIIATDNDPKLAHGTVAVPPLPLPWPSEGNRWLLWSAPAARGGPPPAIPESLWFTANGTTTYPRARRNASSDGRPQTAAMVGRSQRSCRPGRCTARRGPGMGSGSAGCPQPWPNCGTGLAERLCDLIGQGTYVA
jgi:hypothetical protein